MATKEIKPVAAEVSERMTGMIAERDAEMDRLTKLVNNAQTAIRESTNQMEKFASAEDRKGYYRARVEKNENTADLELYQSKIAKLNKSYLVTEEESDAVIDTLLAYENKLSEAFKSEARVLIDQLTALIEDNYQKTGEAEAVIRQWTRSVHPNFRSETATYYDKETGQYTNRSKVPVRVHKEIAGCDAAVSLKNIIEEKVSRILKDKDTE